MCDVTKGNKTGYICYPKGLRSQFLDSKFYRKKSIVKMNF